MKKLTILLFAWLAPLLANVPETPSHFAWSKGFMIEANVRPSDFFDHYLHVRDYRKIGKGDVVWVRTSQLPTFVRHVLPRISQRFILVTGDADDSVPLQRPEEARILLDNKYLVKWFAQNLDGSGPKHSKMEYLPIGLDYHTIVKDPGTFGEKRVRSHIQQENDLLELLKHLPPTRDRICKAYYDAHLVDRMHQDHRSRFGGLSRVELKGALQKVAPNQVVFQQRRLPQHEYFAEKAKYAFCVTTFGYGIDCHRTWECLVLGQIVITLSTTIDPLFEGLPVVCVKSWDEITEENLQKWLQQYGDAFENPHYRQRLTHRFWMNKIQQARALC